MEKRKMNKEQLIQNCITVLGGEQDKATIELLVQSAFAFVNSYTFQDYSLDTPEKIPQDIFFAVIDMVKLKTIQKSEFSLRESVIILLLTVTRKYRTR